MKQLILIWIFNGLGGLFLTLGFAGLFLPLLPATPFLLLSGYCFSKGSPRFYFWILNHKLLGPPVHDWKNHGVIRKSTKWIATVMMGISAMAVYPNEKIPLLGKILFSIVVTAVLTFIWTRPSDKK